jgi:hypothetical protein
MIFNQYSFVWLAAPVVFVAGLIASRGRRGPRWLRIGVVVVLVGLAVLVWLIVHPTASAAVNTLADAERIIGSGKPTVIEFLSEY